MFDSVSSHHLSFLTINTLLKCFIKQSYQTILSSNHCLMLNHTQIDTGNMCW